MEGLGVPFGSFGDRAGYTPSLPWFDNGAATAEELADLLPGSSVRTFRLGLRRGKVSAMGLFDRASRAVSANFNALLDRLEDPKKEVDLTIAEMEEQVRAARQEIVRGVASEKQLKKKVDELGVEAEKWARRAELAVQHGDDDLAREALRQRRRLAGEVERAEALRVEQRNTALAFKADLERMERTVQEVKAKRGLFAARVAQAKAGGGAEGLGARPGDNAFSEFSRMEDQIEGVEAAIVAQREVEEALAGGRGPSGMTREQVEARFQELETKTGGASAGENVDEELRELKAKLRVEPG